MGDGAGVGNGVGTLGVVTAARTAKSTLLPSFRGKSLPWEERPASLPTPGT